LALMQQAALQQQQQQQPQNFQAAQNLQNQQLQLQQQAANQQLMQQQLNSNALTNHLLQNHPLATQLNQQANQFSSLGTQLNYPHVLQQQQQQLQQQNQLQQLQLAALQQNPSLAANPAALNQFLQQQLFKNHTMGSQLMQQQQNQQLQSQLGLNNPAALYQLNNLGGGGSFQNLPGMINPQPDAVPYGMTQMSLSNLSQSIAQNQQQAALLQKHQQLSNLAAHQQQAAAASAGSPFYQSPQKLNMAAASINQSVQNLQAQQARAKSLNLGFTTGAMNQQQQQVGQASQQSNYMQMNNMQQNIDSQRQISQQMQQQQQVKNSASAPSPSQPNQKLTPTKSSPQMNSKTGLSNSQNTMPKKPNTTSSRADQNTHLTTTEQFAANEKIYLDEIKRLQYLVEPVKNLLKKIEEINPSSSKCQSLKEVLHALQNPKSVKVSLRLLETFEKTIKRLESDQGGKDIVDSCIIRVIENLKNKPESKNALKLLPKSKIFNDENAEPFDFTMSQIVLTNFDSRPRSSESISPEVSHEILVNEILNLPQYARVKFKISRKNDC